MKKINIINNMNKVFIFMFIVLISPDLFAATGAIDLDVTLQKIIDFFNGTTARLVAIIAVSLLGWGAMMGKFSKEMAGSIIGGIILVFGASSIVDSFL